MAVDKEALTERAWEVLGEELETESHQARVRAANSIIDRVEGKAAQQINVNSQQTVRLVVASPALAAINPADLELEAADETYDDAA